MDRLATLTPRVRRVIFGLFALCMIGLGVWASLPTSSQRQAASPPAPWPAGSGQTTPSPSTEQSDSPQGSAPVLVAPLSASDLAQAGEVAKDFTATYTSSRWDEDPTARVAALEGLVASGSQVDLGALVPDGALAADLSANRVVIDCAANPTRVQFMSTNSVALVVNAACTTTTTAGTSTSTDVYVVTLRQDGGWRVAEIALAGTAGPDEEG